MNIYNRAKFQSLEKTIFNFVMNKYGLFYDEPILLFLDEMRTSMQGNFILSLIAGGANKLSEIASRLQKPSTHFTKSLQYLIELGYIKREILFAEKEKKQKLAKNWNNYISEIYEDLCRESIPELFKKKGNFLPGKKC